MQVLFFSPSITVDEWSDIRYDLSKHNLTLTLLPIHMTQKVLRGTKFAQTDSCLMLDTKTLASCFPALWQSSMATSQTGALF
jgi:hypothetical protein